MNILSNTWQARHVPPAYRGGLGPPLPLERAVQQGTSSLGVPAGNAAGNDARQVLAGHRLGPCMGSGRSVLRPQIDTTAPGSPPPTRRRNRRGRGQDVGAQRSLGLLQRFCLGCARPADGAALPVIHPLAAACRCAVRAAVCAMQIRIACEHAALGLPSLGTHLGRPLQRAAAEPQAVRACPF